MSKLGIRCKFPFDMVLVHILAAPVDTRRVPWVNGRGAAHVKQSLALPFTKQWRIDTSTSDTMRSIRTPYMFRLSISLLV